MERLKGKIAIVTGSSSGIGKTTAEIFAREGASVVLAARRGELLREVEEGIKAAGGNAISVVADLRIRADCDRVVEEAIAAFGRIDILVNNAGIGDKHRPITRIEDDWWDEVISINQSAIFYITRAALKYMEPTGKGSIINISSIGGVHGSAGIAYSASKSALLGMTKNIAIQFAGKGIRCNCVCPGPTPTPLNTPEQVATFDLEFADRCGEFFNTSIPEVTTEDQANACLYFASDDSKGVTGQILIVDNGATIS